MTTEHDNPNGENIAQTVARLTEGCDPVHFPIQPEKALSEFLGLVAIPEHWKIEDLEKHLPAPRRTKISRDMVTMEGFAKYVTAHALADRTAIYVDHNAALAVIDDVSIKEKSPAWGDHKAILKLEYTPEWNAWKGQSARFLTQRSFVDFIQDRAGEITQPALADLVQQLRGINAETTGSRRDAAGHLSQEAARQQQTKITNELPEFLELSMPLLKCEPDQRTTTQARLYVKLSDDGVTFAVMLVNPEIVIDARLREFVERLKTKIGNKVPVYF